MVIRTKRKPRKGEYTCRCNAYRFPHRFGGGACHGDHIPFHQWNTYFGTGACEECHANEGNSCQVVDGREDAKECPVWQEFVDYESIRLLGKFWRTDG